MQEPKPLAHIQGQVDEWASQYDPSYWQPHEMLARLTEETGELAREVNSRWGPKSKKKDEPIADLATELADILFTVTCMANALDIDLDEAWTRVMDKCWGRDRDRFPRK